MKRIIALCMIVVMAIFMVPFTAKAAQGSVTITVEADKETLNPGDTVNFDVKLGAVTNLGGLDFYLIIPEGLSIKAISMQSGLKDILKSDGDIIPPTAANDWFWCYSVGSQGYTSSSELCILSFSCTVDADAKLEEKTVTLQIGQCFENGTGINFEDIQVNLIPSLLTVEKAKVAVSGVTLNQTSLTMGTKETFKLTAAVEPVNADNQDVSWSSSNDAVASVGTDGTVTALKEGTAAITVTTADGGKTASCAVTVNCSHDLRKMDAVEATCETAGNIEHYICSECGRKFADSEGKSELADVTIAAKGHTADEWLKDERNHWKVCSDCGKEIDKAEHAFHWVIDVAATEDKTGISHEECVCGVKRSENTVLPVLDHVHTGIRHYDAVAADCTHKGSVEYWTCSSEKCAGKYYGDENCQKELASVEIPINPANHIYDSDADDTCNRCGYKRLVIIQGNAGSAGTNAADKTGISDKGNTADNSGSTLSRNTISESPKTGEMNEVSYLYAVMIAGLIAVAAAVFCKKRNIDIYKSRKR